MATPNWHSARRLLCVRLDTLGDVLMSGPAMRALRAARPDRHLTLLTSPSGAEAAELMPAVDEALVYVAPWMKPRREPDAAPDLAIVERLRAGGFDAAVVFTVYTQSALPAVLLCHLAGIPLRLAHCREKPYGLLTDWVPEPEPEGGVRHEVRRQLDLVAAVGSRSRCPTGRAHGRASGWRSSARRRSGHGSSFTPDRRPRHAAIRRSRGRAPADRSSASTA